MEVLARRVESQWDSIKSIDPIEHPGRIYKVQATVSEIERFCSAKFLSEVEEYISETYEKERQ